MNNNEQDLNETWGSSEMKKKIKAIFIGSVGNLIEYYDFYVYSAFALYFAKSFFPSGNELAQQLNTSVIFWGGFVARPFGGWLFGHIADRYGRKLSLSLSVTLMCIGSLVIAVMPTYASIGSFAPLVLVLARIFQGLSLGGEYGASATYLSEVASEKHRGFYSSFQYVTLIGGQLCAIFILLFLQTVGMTTSTLEGWGWRIPFAIGGVLALFAARMRRSMIESESFLLAQSQSKNSHSSSIKELFTYPREFFLVIGLTLGGTAAFYTYTTYMQKFLKLSVKLTNAETTWVTAGSLIFALCLQPLYGAISDKVGRKTLLIAFGLLGTIFNIPILMTLHETHSPFIAFLLISGAWVFVSGYTSINAVVKAELFPAKVRATGVGFPYALTVTIAGGSAESIALAFKSGGHEEWFYYYLTGCIFISFIVYCFMRDTKKASLIEKN